MLQKTRGILLHTTNYTDSSIIVRAYTRDFGLQSYLINGVRGKKTKNKASLFQPLTIAEFVATVTDKGRLGRLSEFSIVHPYASVPFDIVKSSIALFLNEILYKALREDHSDPDLFDFLQNALMILDLRTESCSNYHLFFLLQLSRFLGFQPSGNRDEQQAVFDLKEGEFVRQIPSHGYFLPAADSRILGLLMSSDFEHFNGVEMDRATRKRLLQGLISYYQLHLPGFGEIRSLAVLEEVVG